MIAKMQSMINPLLNLQIMTQSKDYMAMDKEVVVLTVVEVVVSLMIAIGAEAIEIVDLGDEVSEMIVKIMMIVLRNNLSKTKVDKNQVKIVQKR